MTITTAIVKNWPINLTTDTDHLESLIFLLKGSMIQPSELPTNKWIAAIFNTNGLWMFIDPRGECRTSSAYIATIKSWITEQGYEISNIGNTPVVSFAIRESNASGLCCLYIRSIIFDKKFQWREDKIKNRVKFSIKICNNRLTYFNPDKIKPIAPTAHEQDTQRTTDETKALSPVKAKSSRISIITSNPQMTPARIASPSSAARSVKNSQLHFSRQWRNNLSSNLPFKLRHRPGYRISCSQTPTASPFVSPVKQPSGHLTTPKTKEIMEIKELMATKETNQRL